MIIMKRSRRIKKTNITRYVLICAFIAVFAIILAATGIFVQAGEKHDKTYYSIEINTSDTLWGIATDYCDTDKESIQEYIDNIKDINNLSSDKIISGNYIIVYEYK